MARPEAPPAAPAAVQIAKPPRRPFVPLDAPTERESEPLTAGARLGAGPGLEALRLNGDPYAGRGSGIDPDLIEISKHLPTLELLASLPGSSVATRNLVRRLRGAAPVDLRTRGNG